MKNKKINKTKPETKEKNKMTKQKKLTITKIVPDTSVIIEGILSKKLNKKEIKINNLIIHEAVLAELEHQANQNRETGHLGLEEISRLRDLSKKNKFKIVYEGKRPEQFEIMHARSGEIDAMIRHLAFKEKATLITADKVQSKVAQSKGINTIFIEFEKIEKTDLVLDKFFDKKTMSVHIRENLTPYAKKGMPGDWNFVQVNKTILDRDKIKNIAKEIVEEAGMRKDGFIEVSRKGSTIVQLSHYRIVITRPPFSDAWEITAVKPVKQLSLKDYKLSEKLTNRIAKQADGMLIAGSPGMGKTTFAQGLAEHFASTDKIVKTVEAPRDLMLSDSITQYSIARGTPQEIHDILLLSRPDYTIYDEMRNTKDFELFADMRLAGVGMVGVVHATNPIDAIQRFIGRIEMGVIPQIVDTVVFIKNGAVNKVLSLKMTVKVPSGMTEADLARPIVEVNDFETDKLEFEIYSYGEHTVVIPVQEQKKKKTGIQKLVEESIEKFMLYYVDDVEAELLDQNRCQIFIPKRSIPKIIGREGKNIERIEKQLGISIDIQELGSRKRTQNKNQQQPIDFEPRFAKRNLVLKIDPKYSNQDIDVHVEDEYVLTVKSGKKGIIRVKRNSEPGKIIESAIQKNKKIELI
tara:strand:+ start:3740 stop:5641 length:1902 start_codon:yes stop_codon:yes gene_type:complete